MADSTPLKTTPPKTLSKSFLLALAILFTASATQANEKTLFLTWFEDPTTSMVAQWITPPQALPPVHRSQSATTFNAGPLNDITVDGNFDDWPEDAFSIDTWHTFSPYSIEQNFKGNVKLGWNQKGLYFAISASDNEWLIDESGKALWDADSVEIFVGKANKPKQRIQLILSAKGLSAPGKPQHYLADHRTNKKQDPFTYQVARKDTAHSYQLELFIPLSHFDVTPEHGTWIATQIVFNDWDHDSERQQHAFFHKTNTFNTPSSKHKIKLAKKAGNPVKTIVQQNPQNTSKLIIKSVSADAGKKVQVSSKDTPLADSILTPDSTGSHSIAEVTLPSAPAGQYWGTVGISIDDKTESHYTFPPQYSAGPPSERTLLIKESNTDTQPHEIKTTVHAFGKDGDFIQRTIFTGLKPDTRYTFWHKNKDKKYFFRTAPETQTEPIVFAEGGDVGTSHHVPKLHKSAASWNPLFALVGGDLAYADGKKIGRWYEYLKDWHRYMVTDEGDLIPQIVCIGNHEVRGGFNGNREKAPFFYSLFANMYPETGYARLDFGDYLSLLLLDSGHSTPVEGKQTQWLEEQLKSNKAFAHRLVAYHVPAYPAHRDWNSRKRGKIRQHWVPLFEEHTIDAAFEHDDHVYKRTHRLKGGKPDPSGILYIGDGAWGKGGREAASTQDRPYLHTSLSKRHVIRVTLHEEGQSYLVVGTDGKEIDRYSSN